MIKFLSATLLFLLLIQTDVVVAANPIILDLQNASLTNAITMLCRFLSMNVMLSSSVQGNVTLHLINVSPKTAMNLLLKRNNLIATQQDNILYIEPIDELMAEKAKKIKWQELNEDAAPRVSHFWPIKYAKAEEIVRLMQNSHNSYASQHGLISYDVRTNGVYANDIPQKIAAIDRLIHHADIPVKQVALSARLVSIDTDFEQNLGVNFSSSITTTPGQYSLAVARLADGGVLDIKLAALERAGHAQLISSPSLFALNQQEAVIESGEEVPYQEVSDSGGTGIQFKKAVLGLRVTPSILPNGQVLLQLQINQDRPSETLVLGMPTITTRQISTSVLVKTGQMVVLGGIYETNEENSREGIPFLSKLPVFGVLFKQQNIRETKRELLIFITPKIVAGS